MLQHIRKQTSLLSQNGDNKLATGLQCYNQFLIDLLIKANVLSFFFFVDEKTTKMCEFIFGLSFIVRLSIYYRLKSSTAAVKIYLYFRYGFSLAQLAGYQILRYSFSKLKSICIFNHHGIATCPIWEAVK